MSNLPTGQPSSCLSAPNKLQSIGRDLGQEGLGELEMRRKTPHSPHSSLPFQANPPAMTLPSEAPSGTGESCPPPCPALLWELGGKKKLEWLKILLCVLWPYVKSL